MRAVELVLSPFFPGLPQAQSFPTWNFKTSSPAQDSDYAAPPHNPPPTLQSIFSQLRGWRWVADCVSEKQNVRGKNGEWGQGGSNRNSEKQLNKNKEMKRD